MPEIEAIIGRYIYVLLRYFLDILDVLYIRAVKFYDTGRMRGSVI